MSIILKALKKAESATGKQPTTTFKPYPGPKSQWLTIVVVVCTVVLVGFFATYVLKGKSPQPPIKAVKDVKAGLETKPATSGTLGSASLNTDAVALIRAGENARAETLLENAVKKYPSDPYLHNHLGLAMKKQGKLTEAAMEYEKAIEHKPDYYIAMNNLAIVLESLSQKDRSAELYARAIEGDPTISGFHLNYALLLEDKGIINEAESQYHTFLTLSKDENLKGLVRRRLLAIR